MPTRNDRLTTCARSLLVGAVGLVPALGGCVANSSNPVVGVVSANDDEQRATFDLDLYNPGGRHLTVTRLDYSVSHGESLFPVSKGSWTGELDLPARQHATLILETPFDATPIEPDSALFHLRGELCFIDRTGFLGMKSMDLTRTQFSVEAEADRSEP